MVSPVLIQYGLPFLAQVLSEGLKRIDSPAAKTASDSLEKVQLILSGGQVNPEQLAEANRHVETLARLHAEENCAAYEQINESLRAEIASEDKYVRRMRPTFGYLLAITWAAQMFALAYVMMFRTSQAYMVLGAMDSLAAIWAMGLSVLGIYVYKRSEDKKLWNFQAEIKPVSVPLPSRKPEIKTDYKLNG